MLAALFTMTTVGISTFILDYGAGIEIPSTGLLITVSMAVFWSVCISLCIVNSICGWFVDRCRGQRRTIGQRAVVALSERLAEEYTSVGIEVVTGSTLSQCESIIFFSFPDGTPTT